MKTKIEEAFGISSPEWTERIVERGAMSIANMSDYPLILVLGLNGIDRDGFKTETFLGSPLKTRDDVADRASSRRKILSALLHCAENGGELTRCPPPQL